jgi:hypothetical protein
MQNAMAVRFYPLIDVDVDKTTHEVVRIDVSYASSILADLYDYDTEEEFRVTTEGHPALSRGEDAINALLMPALRRALTEVAAQLGAQYHDDQPEE